MIVDRCRGRGCSAHRLHPMQLAPSAPCRPTPDQRRPLPQSGVGATAPSATAACRQTTSAFHYTTTVATAAIGSERETRPPWRMARGSAAGYARRHLDGDDDIDRVENGLAGTDKEITEVRSSALRRVKRSAWRRRGQSRIGAMSADGTAMHRLPRDGRLVAHLLRGETTSRRR